MADRRRVTATRKDGQGDILALCNGGEPWSPRDKWDAIKDIEDRLHSYFVSVDGRRVNIKVVRDPTKEGGKYLRTDPDETDPNNLDNLDDC